MQSGVAMLAQANQLPQNLLRLLQEARGMGGGAAPSRLTSARAIDNRDVMP
jgi:hypothetical protein